MLDERDADGLGNERHGARGADDAVAYGRSRTYMCGRAILQGLPCAPTARPRGSCNQASLRESCPQGVTLRKLAIPNAECLFGIVCQLLFQFNQIEIHQTAVQWLVRTETTEFAFLFFGTEQEFELVILVEFQVSFLVVGIYQQKSTTSLVKRINEPGFYKTQNIASQMLALKVLANPESTDHDCRITAVYLFAETWNSSKSLSPHLNDLLCWARL